MKRLSTSFLLVALACTFGLLGGGIVMYVRSALASRNSAGTYSLASSPVTTLQTISTSLWNNTFADLATGVTDSLDRNGRGGMLAALRGTDGTNAAPAFSYTSETGSGEYRIGAGDLGLSILGTKTGEWTANGYRTANGAVATPSLSFFNDTGSGLYRAGSNDLRFAVNGTDKTFWSATGFGIGGAPGFLLDVVNSAATTSARFGSNFQSSLVGSTANGSGFGGNVYNDGSWKYASTGYGSLTALSSANGNMEFYSAPSGSGGAAATLTLRASVGPTGLIVGSSGTAISSSIRGTASLTPGSVPSLTCMNANITVTGAAAGADCAVGAISTLQGVFATGCIVTANTCAINVCNVSAGAVTPPTGTYACRVFNP